jgi:hypothetical protein
MIKLATRVVKRWREIAGDPDRYGDDTYIEVLFSSRMDPTMAADQLTDALRRVQSEFASSYAGELPAEAQAFPGEWEVTPIPEGALLFGGRKSDDGEALLVALVAELDRRGARGRLDLYATPEAPAPPVGLGMIDAGLRVIGEREPGRARSRWIANRDAYERVVRAATDWCLHARPDRGVTLSSGVLPTMLVRRSDSPFERVRTVMYREWQTTLRSIGEDQFRMVVLAPEYGRVSLLEGGPRLYRAGWHPAVADVKALLASVCGDLVYARVRRERDFGQATAPETLKLERPRHYSLDATAYEDHLAPDAYPIQLLGPGYRTRVPTGDAWRTTELSAERILLEHVDPDAWLGVLSLEAAMRGDSVPSPALRRRAREEFAPILFPDVAFVRRRPDPARARVWLAQNIVTELAALPTPPPDTVTLLLDDGHRIHDVELSHSGAVVERIAGRADFRLDPTRVTSITV